MSDAAKALGDNHTPENEQLRAAVEEARAEVARGEVVPHERVREWLLALAQGKRLPPPTP